MKKEYIINAILYQAGWFSCMLLPESYIGLAITVMCLCIHLYYHPKIFNELTFITSASTIGYSMDRGMNYFDLMDITNKSSNSLYLIIIWFLFSVALRSSSSFIFNKNIYALTLGAIAPMAYVGGQAIGRVKYADPQLISILIHSVVWILTMQALVYLNKKIPTSAK